MNEKQRCQIAEASPLIILLLHTYYVARRCDAEAIMQCAAVLRLGLRAERAMTKLGGMVEGGDAGGSQGRWNDGQDESEGMKGPRSKHGLEIRSIQFSERESGKGTSEA